MFDVGFAELVVIGVVAIMVIGPDKLPQVARFLGSMVGRMQRYISSVKSEMEREMRMEELKQLQNSIADSLPTESIESSKKLEKNQSAKSQMQNNFLKVLFT